MLLRANTPLDFRGERNLLQAHVGVAVLSVHVDDREIVKRGRRKEGQPVNNTLVTVVLAEAVNANARGVTNAGRVRDLKFTI